MKKDVLVSISGLHTDMMNPSDEQEPIEVIVPASYYYKNGKHYVMYEEPVEGSLQDVIKNRIKITGEDLLEISKTGATNAHMIFEKNKKNLTYYGTPYGQMLLGVDTTRMDIDMTEDHIHIAVDYQLDVNHEPLAECEIRMQITSKDSGKFSLA